MNERTPGGIIPTIESLNAAGTRFYDHADSITNAARLDVAHDLRLAARIAAAYAHLRFLVADEAGLTTDAASADRLRDMLVEEM
jgi:hypothetical protein